MSIENLEQRVIQLERAIGLMKSPVVASATEPSGNFDGQLWVDLAKSALSIFSGGKFNPLGSSKIFVGSLGKASGSTGNVGYTWVGFKPKAVLFFAKESSSTNLSTSTGLATSASNMKCHFTFGSVMVATTSYVVRVWSASYTDECSADLVSMDADGFTLNWQVATTGADVFYLALA